MNQAKIWLVVNPNHGLPLLLGAVAGIALLVHLMVLGHTTWYPKYLNGKAAAPVATASAEAR